MSGLGLAQASSIKLEGVLKEFLDTKVLTSACRLLLLTPDLGDRRPDSVP